RSAGEGKTKTESIRALTRPFFRLRLFPLGNRPLSHCDFLVSKCVSYRSMGQALPSRRFLALVVDDNDFVRNFVREILEEQGFEVYVAEDGKTAASIYNKRSDFSLVVTDVLMPAGDGIDFILKIRYGTAAGAAQPKIIAISGGGFIEAEEYL